MKIQVVSDLHLEFKENRRWLRENPIVPKADMLIMAGDTIPYVFSNHAGEFHDKLSKDFQQIYSIFGNHEFYRGEIDIAYPVYDELIRDNMRMLNNISLEIEGIKFIFTTLWSFIPLEKREQIQSCMNDYRVINKRTIFKELQLIQIEDMLNYYEMSLTFLSEELHKAKEQKTVVVTHHVPAMECLTEAVLQREIKYAYANELNGMIEDNPQIKYWICGHHHKADKRVIGKTTIIRNPLGYVFEKQYNDFDLELVIDV